MGEGPPRGGGYLVEANVSKVGHDPQIAAQGQAAPPRRTGPLYGTHSRQPRAVNLPSTILRLAQL